MKTYTPNELKEILVKHSKWLRGEVGGERANLSNADLSNTNLSNTNLSNADLSNTNLSNTNLSNADLSNTLGVIRIELFSYTIIVGKTHSRIGCHYKTNKEWLKVTKKEGVKLGLKAEHYKIYKELFKVGLKALK